jgi:transposase
VGVWVAECGGENNTQWRLIGALNALTGQVCYLDNYIVGRAKVIEMYQKLTQMYPQADRLYVVQDNWSIHRHPDVLDALSELGQIEPVWLPTYAPWLNPIEKLWRWLRQDVLKMHTLGEAWESLRARVNGFLDRFASGSDDLLRYVGLQGEGQLAEACKVT